MRRPITVIANDIRVSLETLIKYYNLVVEEIAFMNLNSTAALLWENFVVGWYIEKYP